MSGVLSREQLQSRIGTSLPLISEWLDLDRQLQPNGFDLTLREVSRFVGCGSLGVTNAERELPRLETIPLPESGFLHLKPGPYHLLFNEVVQLPVDVMALGRPRSSLGRSGVAIHSAVWDAGYHGRSTSLLVVTNPDGFNVSRNARLLQLVFFFLAEKTSQGYDGTYQRENMR